MLKLYRPADRDDSRREERCDVTGSSGEDADRCCCASGAGRPAADDGTPAGCCAAAGAATQAELGQDSERTERGSQCGELVTDAADLPPELPALLTVAQMTSDHAAGAHAAIVGDDQLAADLRAGGVAGLD